MATRVSAYNIAPALVLLAGAVAGADDKARVEAEAMGQAAEADRLFKLGEFAAALPLYQAERASRAGLGDRRYESYAVRAVGCCLANLGDDDAAIPYWLDAMTLDALRDDPGFEGYDGLLIGQAHGRRGRHAEAVAVLTRALPRLTRAVDRDHEADAQLALGDALLKLSRPADAVPRFDRAEALARGLNDARRLAASLLWGSLAARLTGDAGPAAEKAEHAVRAYQSLGMKAEAASAVRALGEALAELDRLDAAAAAFDDAARLHESLDDPASAAEDLALLSAVKADGGDPAGAVAVARRRLTLARDAEAPDTEIAALVSLADYQSQAGDLDGSCGTLAMAVGVARRDPAAPAGAVRLLVLSSAVVRRAGRPVEADALLDEADRVALAADNGALRRIVSDARSAR